MRLEDSFKEIIIKGDKIEKVKLKKRNFEIKNLENKVILPGFIDSHTHLIHEGLTQIFPDLYNTESIEEALSKVKDFEFKEIPFIIALNFDESKWKEKRLPKKKELDKISRDKIVVFRRICGHLAVTNSRGVKYFSAFGDVDKDTGTMIENIPLRLFSILKIPDDLFLLSLEKGINKAIKEGITCVHEMVGKKGFYYFLKLKEKNKLKIRVRYYAPVELLEELKKLGILRGFGDDFFKFCGIKIFTDGSIGSRKAAISFYYKNEKRKGEMLIKKKKFQRILRECENAGFQLAIHAIGNRAIKNILEWSKKIIKKTELRHRIEHAEMIEPHLAEELKEMGFCLSIQPNFILNWQLEKGLYEERLGKNWIYKMNPLKTLMKIGINMGFGSDCMPLSPLKGLKGAMSHPDLEERLDLKEAISLYTKGSAYLSFDENILGDLKKRMKADIVIISKNKIKKVIIDGKSICL